MPSRFVRAAGFERVMNGFEDLLDSAGSDTWIVGTNVRYGLYLEFGTRNHPPYPWLRPAIEKVAENDADEIADNAESTEELVAEIALAIERRAKEITDSRGERPFRQTGNLSASIEAQEL
jgi:hypothetical protein